MKRTAPRRSAFTLAELLVAVAITVLVVAMLGIMFGSLINTATRSNERIDAFRDARAALLLMRRDLEGLVRAQPAPYFEIDTDLSGPDIRQLYALASVKNQVLENSTLAPGDLCALRYYSAWTGNAYALHRVLLDSSQTQKSFQANLSNGVLSYTSPGSLYYNSAATDEAIVSYAWDLQVVAYDSSGNVVNVTPDINGNNTTGAPYVCDPSGSTNLLPQSVEVSFKAISADAARTIIAATTGRSDAYTVWQVVDNKTPTSGDQTLYNNLIKPYTYNFRTRVYFNR